MGTPAAVPYSDTSTDPLSLGSMVQCIDTGGIGGFEAENRGDLRGADGYLKQSDVKGWKDAGTVRYNPLGAMSWSAGSLSIDSELVVYPGQTANSDYIVFSAKPGKTNEGYDTVDVSVEKLIKTAKSHTW